MPSTTPPSLLFLLLLVLTAAAAVANAAAQQAKQQCYDLQTEVLGRSGLQFGSSSSGVYGVHVDAKKQPIVQLLGNAPFQKPLSSDQVAARANGAFTKDAKLADAYSNAPDFPSLHEVPFNTYICICRKTEGGGLWSYALAAVGSGMSDLLSGVRNGASILHAEMGQLKLSDQAEACVLCVCALLAMCVLCVLLLFVPIRWTARHS